MNNANYCVDNDVTYQNLYNIIFDKNVFPAPLQNPVLERPVNFTKVINGTLIVPQNIHGKEVPRQELFIKDVKYNGPATIVFWSDGTKTIAKCEENDKHAYSKESGLAICIAKKYMGNKDFFNAINSFSGEN